MGGGENPSLLIGRNVSSLLIGRRVSGGNKWRWTQLKSGEAPFAKWFNWKELIRTIRPAPSSAVLPSEPLLARRGSFRAKLKY